MLYKDRFDAAMKLIPFLEKYKNERGVVLAVPRGGVPIGYHIAKNLNFPLELMVTKKIGHPLSSEVAVGAVSLEGHIVDDRHNLPPAYIENEIRRIRQSLKERYHKFMGNKAHVDVEGKTVIIVDDGVATGNTLFAAIKMLRQKDPKRIVVAVPVSPYETANKMRKLVDDLICPHILHDFVGVGMYYNDFSEVSDEEVIELLKDANHFENAA